MEEVGIRINEQLLSSIKSYSFYKRLNNELNELYKKYENVFADVNDKQEAVITIYCTENSQFNKYEFIIGRGYPFRPPAICYQDKPYIEFLKTKFFSKESKIAFEKVTGMNCFCCSSITCHTNWGPCITMDRIIKEIQLFKTKKRNIINKLMADKIKYKYLIDDIDLDSWLF